MTQEVQKATNPQLVHFVPELHADLCHGVAEEPSSFHTAGRYSNGDITLPVSPSRMEIPYSPAEWISTTLSSDSVLGAISVQPGTGRRESHAQYLVEMTPHFYASEKGFKPPMSDEQTPRSEFVPDLAFEDGSLFTPHNSGSRFNLITTNGDGVPEAVPSLQVLSRPSSGAEMVDRRSTALSSMKKHLLGPVDQDEPILASEDAAQVFENRELPVSNVDGSASKLACEQEAEGQAPEIQLKRQSSSLEQEALPFSRSASTLSNPESCQEYEASRGKSSANGEEVSRTSTPEDDKSFQNRNSWDALMGGMEEKLQSLQREKSTVDTIKRNEEDQMRKSRGEETAEDRERAQLRKEARAKREAELLQRRFLQKSKVWKLNTKATGESKDMWRLRLLMLDGGGHLTYVSEKDAGEIARVCTVADMLYCDMVAQPHAYCFPYVFRVGFKGAPIQDKDKEARTPSMKDRFGGRSPSVCSEDRVSSLRSGGWGGRSPSVCSVSPSEGGSKKSLTRLPTLPLFSEKSITFAAESEEVAKQWVQKLQVYLVQSELPSHLVMAQAMFTKTRTMVSGHRRRYVDGKFDLDLTYITSRIIAMAFPAEDSIGQFSIAIRNDLRVVKNFLDEKHPRKYKVFNLCAEKQYHPSKFDNNVEWIPFLDHNPPTLGQIKSFCYKVEKWLLLDPNNVVAVHCKGGKGRTGLMIACYLLANGRADETPINTAQEAMDYFADRRTNVGLRESMHPQTVSGVSQIRCVKYFEEGHAKGLVFRRIRLTHVHVTKVPDNGGSHFQPILRVSSGAQEVYRSPDLAARCCSMGGGSKLHAARKYASGSSTVMELDCTDKYVFVSADFKLELFDGNPSDEGQRLADQATCYACLHASKAEKSPIVLQQGDIDQAARDLGRHKVFPAGFEMRIFFETVEPADPRQTRSLTFNEDHQLSFSHRVVAELEPDLFESGETVQRAGQGDAQSRLYLVGKGSVRLERGEQVLQGAVGPLEIFGEQQFLLDNVGLPGDVVANLDPTIVYPIDRQTFHLYFDSVGSVYQVLCIKLATKALQNAINLGMSMPVLEDAADEEVPAKEQKTLRLLDLPVTERILEQAVCSLAVSGSTARQSGTMMVTHNFLIFSKSSLTGSSRLIINLARVLMSFGRETEGGEYDLEVNCALPLSHGSDHIISNYTFHFPSTPTSSVLQDRLNARGSIGLSWTPGSASPSWPLRADEALAMLFQFMSPQPGGQRASFVRRSFSMVRPASFGSRTAGEVVNLGSGAPMDKVKSWRSDSTVYIVLKGAIVVTSQNRVVERYEPGELFGLAQYIDPSQKDVLHVRAAHHGGAQLKVIPAEHLRKMLARDTNFHASFWEFGAKVLAWRLRRGSVF